MSNPAQPSASVALPAFTIAVNTISFALCFALWVVFGPSTKLIAKEFHLAPGTAALLKSAPILIGSVFRMPIGMLTDRLGARIVFPSVMLAGSVAALAVSFATSPPVLIVGAFLLGIIGTSFAVGVQSISTVTERSRQGYALGIFGVGNVGSALTTFSLPWLLLAVGWRASFRCVASVVAVGAVCYFMAMSGSKCSATPIPFRTLVAPLRRRRTWLFGLYYMASFGVFVASILILSDIYTDAYRIAPATAGLLATAFTVVASVSRIPGGMLSDRFGADLVLKISLAATACMLAPVLAGPPLVVAFICIGIAGVAMGVGSAATFKLIPEHFPNAAGAVGGLVGAIGGVAGFFLPQLAGIMKASSGVYMQLTPLIALVLIALASSFGDNKAASSEGRAALSNALGARGLAIQIEEAK